ncbi:MAG: hypothetical protein GX088_00575 [Clostridia bacterium]|nr:hypothetical protein [Clostridia bacterium]
MSGVAGFIRSKIFAGVLLVSIAAFALGGVTMAWFTDDNDISEKTFKAGTVVINADDDEPIVTMPKGEGSG